MLQAVWIQIEQEDEGYRADKSPKFTLHYEKIGR